MDPFEVYRSLGVTSPSVLLESLGPATEASRFSFIGTEPFLEFRAYGRDIQITHHGRTRRLKTDPWQVLRKLLEKYRVSSKGKRPFENGAAVGYFGYEMKNFMTRRNSRHASNDLKLPDAYFLFFKKGQLFDRQKRVNASASRALVPHGVCKIKPRTTRSQFLAQVRKTKEHIRKGNIYQLNLSQRFDIQTDLAPLQIYERLRWINPSPYFAYLDAGDFQIVSGSPERLLQLKGKKLETRPIAGTRSRGRTAREDRALSRELFLSEKERAEHIMLVDLERNDLGRVCRYGSVRVDELMELENYSHVKHIVSNVTGVLKPGLTGLDAVKAFFPGGTITGVPKVRCMEIIDELESVARGPYTGSLGYFDFSGDMDFNILIRSVVCRGGRAYLQVGAGIVADSIAEREYDETLHKAGAVVEAIGGRKLANTFLRGRRA